jgi:hypothetical protein
MLRQKITLTLMLTLKQKLMRRKSTSSFRITSKVRKRKMRGRRTRKKTELPKNNLGANLGHTMMP